MRTKAILLPSFLCAGAVLGQSVHTVPSGYDSVDAPSLLWLAGATTDLHQQILIDDWHLQPMVGRSITAILWRRNATAETFVGGSATMAVQLATTAAPALAASPSFAANLGSAPVAAYSGSVTFPTAAGLPQTGLTWDASDTVRIQLAVPFLYQGGTLVLDVQGTAASPAIAWWPADAAYDTTTGTVQSSGAGCGAHANAAGEWAFAAARSFVAGASAHLWAHGTEHGLAILLLGAQPLSSGWPLASVLAGAPAQCMVYQSLSAQPMLSFFDDVPFPGEGGNAHFRLPIPNQTFALGATLTAQWFDVAQLATSNGLTCTIAPAPPGLGMVLVTGMPGSPAGTLSTHVAHVLRFEYQ